MGSIGLVQAVTWSRTLSGRQNLSRYLYRETKGGIEWILKKPTSREDEAAMGLESRTYVVDGTKVRDLRSMCSAFGEAVSAPNGYFGFDLQSFDDCFFGGFGLEAPCVIVWRHAAASRAALDGKALAVVCEDALARHQFPDDEGERWLRARVEDGLAGRRTLFDEVVALIATVSERGPAGWAVRLVLD